MTTRKPTRASASLPADSLAYALRHAAGLVAAVIQGRNLTDAFERLQDVSPDWTPGVRGAVRDLAWSTLRDFGRGDLVLRELVAKPLPLPVHALLLVALQRLDARPELAHVIVDQAVEAVAAISPNLKGVVNGVLRSRLRQAERLSALLDADEVSRHCHPTWWIARVRHAHPDAWEAVLAAGNQHPPMSVRVNTRRTTVDALEALLVGEGVVVRRLAHDALLLDRPVPVARLPGFADGMLSVQDAGAQRAAHWLGAEAGQRVLDACAAPGGKSAHILELADVHLLALDIDAGRIQRVRDNLARLGLAAETLHADVRELSGWWDGRPFDRILADVPCSASGVVRRHPDIKWLRRDTDIAGFVRQQREIFEALWQTLAPDGRMLYATCSVFDEENAAQIEYFAHRHADLERMTLDGRLEQQLLPDAEHDGFFYALLRKRP